MTGLIPLAFASLLVYHFDFNSHQPDAAAVVRTLDHLAQQGYNAVLWEVENKVQSDCCPEIAVPGAFTKAEFREMLDHAERLGLEPIPLLQTLGHSEYVLGLGRYRALRESDDAKDCYCLSNPQVVALLRTRIREYLDLFGPKVRRFHLGGDEVECFRRCDKCRTKDPLDLYVGHLTAVSADLTARGVRPGVWHDMLQRFDRSCASFASLPAGFTVWQWEYFKSGGENWASCGEKALSEQIASGREIVRCCSTQCYTEDPFMVRYGMHRGNVSYAAEVARREKMAGLCVTAWAVHQGAREFQFPLYDFAARRYLRPGASADADWAEVVGEYFGRMPVRTLDALTAWDDGLFPADGRYGRYKDCTIPERGAIFKKFKCRREEAKTLSATADRLADEVSAALSEIGNIRGNGLTSFGRMAVEAGELKRAYLCVMSKGLLGENPETLIPQERTIGFYRREMTAMSATNATAILYR